MFGERGSFYSVLGPASATAPGNVTTGTQGFMGQKNWQVPAQAGVAEPIASWSVVDDPTASITFANSNATDGVFVPQIKGVGNTTFPALGIYGAATSDSGVSPVLIFDVRTAANAAIATRPLCDLRNNGVSLLQLLPLNAGANAALSFTTTGQAAPAFTNRSIGSRILLAPNTSGTTVDSAIGYSSVGPWISMFQATSSYEFDIYAGTTNIAQFRGDGLFNNGGSIRATGSTAPASGVGVEVDYGRVNATTGSILSYARSGSAYKDLCIDASTIYIRPAGAAAITCDTVRSTFGSGIAKKTTVSIGAGPFTLGSTDYSVVNIPTVSAATTFNLDPSPVTGQEVTITDGKGIAAANNVFIQGNGKTINSAAAVALNSNYASKTLRYNGTEWNIVASF